MVFELTHDAKCMQCGHIPLLLPCQCAEIKEVQRHYTLLRESDVILCVKLTQGVLSTAARGEREELTAHRGLCNVQLAMIREERHGTSHDILDVPCHPGWGGHWGLGGVWTYHAIT